jgi:hypothetical protein
MSSVPLSGAPLLGPVPRVLGANKAAVDRLDEQAQALEAAMG